MTIIVGMYYDNGDGAIVAADSRTMRGGDYSIDQKLHRVEDCAIFASAGLAGMVEKLIPKVEETRNRTRQWLSSEILNIFEDEMAKLNERYKMTRPYRFPMDESLLQAIIGLIDDKKPKLYTLYDNGYGEIIHDNHAVGHGARHAKNILRTLYRHDITKERAIEIAVHILTEVAEVDALVDSNPQIATLEVDEKGNTKIEVLNEDNNGKFQIISDYVKPIRDKVQGIEQKRAEIFHDVLDGTLKLSDINPQKKEKQNVEQN